MASSSSSSSSSTLTQKHDVFLSFRGEDTRDNFTSHLYAALRRKKIGTYIDYNGLNKGDEISPALVQAISESKISVIIFSKNYASSTWCLDELVHILSCKEGINGQLVIPVFYGVDPSHVRKQQGSYATALAALGDSFGRDSDKVERWREALASAASLSGWDSSVIK